MLSRLVLLRLVLIHVIVSMPFATSKKILNVQILLRDLLHYIFKKKTMT